MPEINALEFRLHTSRLVRGEGPDLDRRDSSLLGMALGLAGESGEVCDELKKVYLHGKPADPKKFLNELGDVIFYVDRIAAHFGYDLNDVMLFNVEKLQQRYPEGFDNAEKKYGFTAEEGA